MIKYRIYTHWILALINTYFIIIILHYLVYEHGTKGVNNTHSGVEDTYITGCHCLQWAGYSQQAN